MLTIIFNEFLRNLGVSEKQSRTEYNREYAKKRRSTEEGRQENVETVKKWREENPEAYRASQRELMRRLRAEKKAKAQQEADAETEEKRDIEVEKAKHN
jgi:ribosome recycling factor